MKIIKIMGCSGAGKTTAARSLLDLAEHIVPSTTPKGKDEAYITKHVGVPSPVILLGNYRGANCGGMDTVDSASEAIDMVRRYHDKGHVVHEGLLQSTYYGKMGTDSQAYGLNYIYARINTPIEVCLDRVVHRREVNGSTNKFNPQLTRDKHAQVQRAWETARSKGHTVATLYWDESMYPQLLELLK
jgi:hypothetical protein